MQARRLLPLLASLALLACVDAPMRADEAAQTKAAQTQQPQPRPEPEPSVEPKPATESHESLTRFGMPEPGQWSNEDYASAYKAINAIAKQDPSLLPRAGSPTFAAIADTDHIGLLAGGVAPEQLVGLSLSLGMMSMVYGDQARRDPEFERESLMLEASVLAATTKLPATVVRSESEAEALRDDPKRLDGLLRYRHGIATKVADMLAFAPKSKLSFGFACEQLARVIDDAAPLLLGEERAASRARLEACTSAGADPKAVEQLGRALAEDAPTAVLVTALLAEHREFAAAQ